jgi:hypothetical protein
MGRIYADFDSFAIFGLEGIRFVGYFLLKEFFLLERRTLCLAFFNHKGREGGRKGHEDASLFCFARKAQKGRFAWFFFKRKGREGGRKGHEDASLFLLGHGYGGWNGF